MTGGEILEVTSFNLNFTRLFDDNVFIKLRAMFLHTKNLPTATRVPKSKNFSVIDTFHHQKLFLGKQRRCY